MDGLAPHFQLVLTKDGRLDRMSVRVEAAPDCTTDRRASLSREIAASVKDKVGVGVTVDVVDPEAIERSVGKFRRIIDQRSC